MTLCKLTVQNCCFQEFIDNLPQYVCYLCCGYLYKFYQFHKKCHKAREILRDSAIHYDLAPVDFIEHIGTKKSLLKSQNLSVINCTIDISVNTTELPLKSEFEEESCDTKSEFDIRDYDDIKLDSPEYCKDDFIENIPSPESSDSDDEPLSLRVAREKERQMCKKEITVSKKKKLTKKKFFEDFADVIVLSKEQQLKEVENRKNSLNYLNSPFKCNKCYKGFLEDAAFKNHMARHEENSGEFTCEICQIRCETERKLRSHCISTHERKYACRECSHISNTCNQAREHEKWHKGHTYSCEICGQVFRKSTTRLTHVRLRHPTQYVCDVCGDSFIGSHGLTMHKRRMHKDAPEKTTSLDSYCAECNFRFASKHALDRHVSSSAKHSGDNKFCHNCRICGDAYKTEEILRAHYKTHVRPRGASGAVTCEQCGVQFSDSKKCSAHHRRVHLGLKLTYNKNIVCEICGKKCTSNSTLQYHQRTHTGEKPYQCSVCPKRFSVRQRLQIHERTHTGERPYPCPHCPKAFRHKPALNRHTRVHTGAKPYSCPYCKKAFSQSNSMKIHIQTVHFKMPTPYRNKKAKINEGREGGGETRPIMVDGLELTS